jgi:hypothetical protein
MSLMKSTAIALAALTALAATGTASSARAGGFKKHGHLVLKPIPHKPLYWSHPNFVGIGPKYVCHWSPRMHAYGYWKFGVFVPCWW